MTPSRPSLDRLRLFDLGELPPNEAAEVEAWVQRNPKAANDLRDGLSGEQRPDVIWVSNGSGPINGSAPHPSPVSPGPTAVSPPGVPPQANGDVCFRFIGGFRIVREIGRGGMGVVYEGVDEGLDRRAAVKVLHPELARNPEHRERFLREGKALAAIKSPHVVTILQASQQGGQFFLAMEFLEGQTLENWLQAQNGPPAEKVVLRIAHEVLTGLAAAHEQGILHRDIKPVNLWVESRTEQMKLLDFGLTRDVDDDGNMTKPGEVMGTAAYMAPEQARGQRVDKRTDLFSVGVVLYRMLAGNSPFARSGWVPTLVAVETEDPGPLGGVRLPLNQFIARLMAKDPKNRPADANEALRELDVVESALANQGSRRKRRKWLLASIRTGIALLFVGVVSLVLYQVLKPIDQKVREPEPKLKTREFPITPDVKMVFCWVPPGLAEWGSLKAEQDFLTQTHFGGQRPDWLDHENEGSRGVYRRKGFWLGRYEVTQGEWMAVTKEPNPSYFDGAKDNNAKGMQTTGFPVESVSWDDCQRFLKALNELNGVEAAFGTTGRFTLPHEDEWEYACRGGHGNSRPYYWGSTLNGVEANCDGNNPYGAAPKTEPLLRTAEVGSYEAKSVHPWGLCDMAGNVSEWCQNTYRQSDTLLVHRGGSWNSSASNCRSAFRGNLLRQEKQNDLGFRVCFHPD